MTRMIFVCGLHRSGTTLLEHYLYSHFEVAALRAPVPENEGQFLQDIYKPAHHYGGPGKFSFSKKMQQDLIELTNYKDYASRLLECWSRYSVGTGKFLLEKSPSNITKIWWLRKIFPDAVFLVWTRDPRAVSGATLKWSKTSLIELIQHWSTAYSIARDDIDSLTIIMRYEDFCISPENCVEQSGITKFLTRRPEPLDIPERFRHISNLNLKYEALFDNIIVKGGIWEYYGYKIL